MSFLKKLLLRASEGILAVAIVLLFFLCFMGIISFSFPQGQSLRDMMLQTQWTDPLQGPTNLDLDLGDVPPTANAFIARLTETRRTVKNKRSNGIMWNHARSGMLLENRDSVQTYKRSGALIAFGTDNQVDLGENSLIVIRQLEPDRKSSSGRASMLLLDGTLQGRTAADRGDRVPMEFITAGGSAMVVPAGAQAADFKITMNPDETSTFTVYGGIAEVVSGGRSVLLKPNRSITLAKNEVPGKPTLLPGQPSPVSPANGSIFAYRNAPPRVRFDWEEPARRGESYSVKISRDPEFHDVVHEERVEGRAFVHGNLKAGRYYWRVAAVSGWAEGVHSAPRVLNMVFDDEPPALDVTFPDRPVEDDLLVLRGAAEPGSEVYVGNRSVATEGSGHFEVALDLKRGLNVVVIEAVDTAGNIAYRSSLVNAKY